MSSTNPINYLSNVSHKKKLFIGYFVTIFIPLIIIGAILSRGMYTLLLNNAIERAQYNVDSISNRIDSIFEKMSISSEQLYTDEELVQIASTYYLDDWTLFKALDDFKTISNLSRVYREEIGNIIIYVENDSLMESGTIIRANSEIIHSEWYQNVKALKGKILWVEIPQSDGKNKLALTRALSSKGKNYGVIVIEVNEDILNEILSTESFTTIISDSNNQIVISHSEVSLESLTSKIDFSQAEGMLDIVDQGNAYKVIYNDLDVQDINRKFYAVSFFETDQVLAEATEYIRWSSFIIGISFVLSVILIILLSNFLNRRIKQISKDMHIVALGNLNHECNISGTDEVGQLAADMNLMVRNLKELIYEVYEVNLQKNKLLIIEKENRLKLLISQINPHFLFNTLEAIRMEVYLTGNKALSNIVRDLGLLIRRNIKKDNKPILIKEELDFIESYLQIQQFRFEKRLKYRIDCLENIKQKLMYPFLIQPIVENAVIHGIEPYDFDGFITIRLFVRENDVVIQVEDNGIGIEQDKLQELRKQLEPRDELEEYHIGLRNVNERIKLYYGHDYGIAINSIMNRGTRVELQFPLKGSEHIENFDN